MANQTITQLPPAGPITGTESVPIVQNGQTVRTTTGAISASPSQTQTFLTVSNEPTLPNSRYFSTDANLTLTDGGAQSFYRINLTGAAASLNTAGDGLVVKSGTSILSRILATSGNGLSVANASGLSGNPTISLSGNVEALANAAGTGMLVLTGPSALTFRTITGTTYQIDVANGSGIFGNPTIGLANNPIIPGVQSLTIPKGADGDRPGSPVVGMIRYNTTTASFEGYTLTGWGPLGGTPGVSLINTGTGLTGGPITTTGTISLADTAVTPGAYTSANITVDAQGRITAASSTNPVTSVGAVSPVQSSGGTTPSISMPQANGSTSGYLSAADWTAFDSKGYGTVTSITAGTGLSGGTITASGTIAISNTGVTAATYGSGSSVPQIAVNAQGQITSATDVAITPSGIGAVASVSGTLNEITSTGTTNVTLSLPSALTFTGKTVTGGTFNSPTFVTPALGTPSSGTLTNATGLPISTGVSGLGTGVATFLATPTSANLAAAVTDETGSGALVFGTSPTIASPAITDGTIDNTTIGVTTPAAGTFTSVAMTSGTVTTTPTNGNDIVNKIYADSIAAGINFHQSCVYATTTALPSSNYNNGTSGVGATLTATANGALVIDGHTFVSPADVGLRVLIKNQANAAYNGVYTVTQTGDAGNPFILTRATDFNTPGSGVNQIDAGDFFLVTQGTANANTSWVQQTPLPITMGTTGIVFTQFGAPLVYSAGTGLTESPAYTFNIANTGVSSGSYGGAATAVTLAINAQGQITSATDVSIAIAASQVTSGTFGVVRGGTGLSSYAAGDLIYATGSTALTSLAIGSSGYVLTSSGTAPQYVAQSTLSVGSATTAANIAGGSTGAIAYNSGAGATTFLSLGTSNYVLTAGATAPQYVAQSTLSVGNATNATNTAITDDTTTNATVYPTWVTANTGNLPQKVTSTKLSFNPSTGALTATGGISGGTF